MSTASSFFYPFLQLLARFEYPLLKKLNSDWSRVSTWVNFWQLNNNFLFKSESLTTILNRSSYAGWQQHGEHHNNGTQNSDRPSILLKLKKEKKNTYASILPLSPRLIIAPVLHPEWKAIDQRISTNL